LGETRPESWVPKFYNTITTKVDVWETDRNMNTQQSYDIRFISDGCLFSAEDIVIGLCREKVVELAPRDEVGRFAIPINNFLFRRGADLVLIDAGAGNTMQPSAGKLRESLAAATIAEADITHVVLTHLHPDHANGLIDDDLQAVYPNATLVIPEAELDFWLAADPGSEPENVARNRRRTAINLAPYADRIVRAREGQEFVGLTPMLSAGHTPGHTVWFGESGGRRFVAWGDLVHLAAVQIPYPDAAVVYDFDKAGAAASRKRLFDKLSVEDITILGAHLDSPGAGRLVRRGSSYAIAQA